MLYLRTGLPGSGKTLNTIREIELEYGPSSKYPGRELRTVYYYGIPDLDTDKLKCKWVEFDTPDEWYNLPDGSIIVIDEAQRVFGAQDGRKARPEKVARFETHRHQGLDIYLITQHPSLLMAHVRKLVGKHINLYRPYGGKRLLRHEYEFCIDAPEKRSNFKMAQERRIKLDPAYFGVYKSATVHTHTFKLPNYVWWIPGCIVFIAVCFYYAYWSFTADLPDSASKAVDQPAQASKSAQSPADPRGLNLNPLDTASKAFGGDKTPLSADEYAAFYEPRIPNVPSSAPAYDKITQPKSYPRLTCASSFDPLMVDRAYRKGFGVGDKGGKPYACQCFTQQLTRVQTDPEFCLSVVEQGYFDPALPDRQMQPGNSRSFQEPAAATGRVPAAQMPQQAASPTMTRESHSTGDYKVGGLVPSDPYHVVDEPAAEYVGAYDLARSYGIGY